MGPRAAAASQPQKARQLAALVYGQDLREVAEQVSMPTVVMHGTADAIVTFKLGKELATLLPNASFVALDGVGLRPDPDATRASV